MHRTQRAAAVQGVIAMLPLAIACFPWGILTGALAIQSGFSAIQAQLMSLLVFAGAAQLSALTMYGAGSGLIPILGSTFVISSRHLLYSITFRKHVAGLSATKRWPLAFVLTDEMFAVSEADTRQHGRFSYTYALVSGFTFHVMWNVSTAMGIFAGEAISNLEELGLEFAIAATFIAMTFDQFKSRPVASTIIVSGAIAVVAKPFLPDAYIIIASLIGMTVGYLLHDDGVDEESVSMRKGGQ